MFVMLKFLTCYLMPLAFMGILFAEEVSPKDRLIVETLTRLNRFDVSGNEKWKGAVERFARSQRGEEGYFELVEQFSVEAELPELLRLVQENPAGGRAAKAVQVVFALGRHEKLSSLLASGPGKKADAIAVLISFVKTPKAEKLLERYKALNVPSSNPGKGAPAILSTPEDIKGLAARVGNAEEGKAVFQKFCFACHKAGTIGIDYGPGLSEIGAKLPKSELIIAIVKPNAGISFDYEGWTLETKQGSFLAGIISESEEELTVRMAGGVSQTIHKKDVAKRTKMEASLMPEGLHLAMSEKELVDLVEFLAGLK